MDRRGLVGSGYIVLAAVGFGTLGSVSRLAEEAGLPTLGFILWRAGLAAAVVLGAVLALGAVGRARTPRLADVPRSERAALLLAGFSSMVVNLAMFTAFSRTSVALALITFYCYPALVTVAGTRLYGEPIDRIRGGALLLASGGLILVVLGPVLGSAGVRVDLAGVALALFAAGFQTVLALVSARGFPSVPAGVSAGLMLAMAALCYLPLAALTGGADTVLGPLRQADLWLWVAYAAVVGAAVPVIAQLQGMRLIGASRAAILMTLEPVVGVLLAAVFLAEQPSVVQVAGGLLVIAAGVALQLPSRARQVRAAPV